MLWLGRFQLGDFLPIPVPCRDASRVEVSPTAAPNYSIYDGTDTVIVDDLKMVPHDKPTRTGWFYAEHQLGSGFAVGRYNGLIQWASGGNAFAKEFCFEIVAGGSASGAYIGLEYQASPQARFVVGLVDSGSVEQRKNPST